MKRFFILVLLMAGSVATCSAQRHPYNSRPYHPPDRRETRRPQQSPANTVAIAKPQPVSVPAPKQSKRK